MLRFLSLVFLCLFINACQSKPKASDSDDEQLKRLDQMMFMRGPQNARI